MYVALTISFVTLAITAAAVVLLRRLKVGRDASLGMVLQHGPDGETVVPVRSLFKGGAHNSLRPFLALTPDGLRFRLLFEERWTFAELARVDAGPTMFGANLEFKSRGHGTLVAGLAGLHIARQVVQALPPDIELTPRAAALRA